MTDRQIKNFILTGEGFIDCILCRGTDKVKILGENKI